LLKKIIFFSLPFLVSTNFSMEIVKSGAIKYLPYAVGAASAVYAGYTFDQFFKNPVFKGVIPTHNEKVASAMHKNNARLDALSATCHFLNMIAQIAVPGASMSVKIGAYAASALTFLSPSIQRFDQKAPFNVSCMTRTMALFIGLGINLLYFAKKA
jgi:hypothetical protein